MCIENDFAAQQELADRERARVCTNCHEIIEQNTKLKAEVERLRMHFKDFIDNVEDKRGYYGIEFDLIQAKNALKENNNAKR